MDFSNLSVEKNSLCEQVADKLENMILSDNTKLERKLPSEQSLAVAFGVSRPVIREALKLLRARGLVIPRNGEGTFICCPDPSMITDTMSRIAQLRNIDVESVYEVRITLELMAVRLCAERIDEKGLAALRKINDELEVSDNEKRTQIDIAFHQKIATLSGNPVLEIFIDAMVCMIAPIILTTVKDPNVLMVVMDDPKKNYHRRILEALENHDAVAAEVMMQKHLLYSLRNYEEAIRSLKE